jgi:hypothetical protein
MKRLLLVAVIAHASMAAESRAGFIVDLSTTISKDVSSNYLYSYNLIADLSNNLYGYYFAIDM